MWVEVMGTALGEIKNEDDGAKLEGRQVCLNDGHEVGIIVGARDGIEVREADGKTLGLCDGLTVGRTVVGMAVGALEGTVVGVRNDGAVEGAVVAGALIGWSEGVLEGYELVGDKVGMVDDARDGALEGLVVRTLLGKYDGFCVGEELSGPLNSTLKPDSFGLLTEATKLIMIVPEVTTTSTGKATSTPYPSCAYRSILLANMFLLLVPSPMFILKSR